MKKRDRTGRPLRILHTEWSRGWGGQEIRILAESEAFLKRGYEVRIACKPGSPIMAAALSRGIPAKAVAFIASIDLRTVISLAGYLKRNKIDIVHTHSSVDSWSASAAARLAGVRVVRSRHLSTPISRSIFSRFLYMGLADRVITSGRAIKEQMVRVNRFNPDKIVSIPAGVDEAVFRPGLDPGPVRRELGLAENAYVLGIVAIIRSWKGHQVLLEAVHQLGDDIPGLKLLIVGDGPARKVTEDRARDLNLQDRVIFTGYRRDVPELLAAMNQFVLPSTKNEATSQVIPQAMLMGVPVIASTAGGLTEVVEHGRTGLLVPPDDPEAIKAAVLANYRRPDQARAMAAAARREALKKWTFTAMIDRTEAVYLDLLGLA